MSIASALTSYDIVVMNVLAISILFLDYLVAFAPKSQVILALSNGLYKF